MNPPSSSSLFAASHTAPFPASNEVLSRDLCKMASFMPWLVMMLALLPGAGSPALQAQELWQGATFGMSVGEVRALHPDAKPPETDPQRLAYGAVEGLRIDPHRFAGLPFFVYFYFMDRALVQVTLSAKQTGAFSDMEPAFDQVAAVLEAGLGPPLNQNRRVAIVSSVRKEWVKGETRVSLLAIGAGTSVFLNLNYQPLELPKRQQ